jgi:hypothetical protein
LYDPETRESTLIVAVWESAVGNPEQLSVLLVDADEPVEAPKSLIGSGWLKKFLRDAAILADLPDATNRSLTQRAWDRRALPSPGQGSSVNGSSQSSQALLLEAAIDDFLAVNTLHARTPPADGESEDHDQEQHMGDDPVVLVAETQDSDGDGAVSWRLML